MLKFSPKINSKIIIFKIPKENKEYVYCSGIL